MAGETIITVIGNLTSDPELRFTPSGAAVANFTIASTPRTFDRQANEFKDGDTLFLRCSVWREAAENVAESLTKGMRVIAQGNLTMRAYTTKEGENRTSTELQVQEIGPSLKSASAKVTRTARGNGEGAANRGGGFGGTPTNGSWTPDAGSNAGAWGAPAGGTAGGWGTGAPTGDNEPPF